MQSDNALVCWNLEEDMATQLPNLWNNFFHKLFLLQETVVVPNTK